MPWRQTIYLVVAMMLGGKTYEESYRRLRRLTGPTGEVGMMLAEATCREAGESARMRQKYHPFEKQYNQDLVSTQQ